MWNPFKKKNNNTPTFKLIEQYIDKDKYPARVQKWDWLDESQIYIPQKNEDGKLSMNTMDFWLQEIFLDSTGEKTIEEIFEKMKEQYINSKMEIPKELDKVLIETIETLTKELGFIELNDGPINLGEEILLPLSKQ